MRAIAHLVAGTYFFYFGYPTAIAAPGIGPVAADPLHAMVVLFGLPESLPSEGIRALVGSQWTIDVVEPDYPCPKSVILSGVTAQLLRVEFLPAVAWLWVGRVGIFLLEGGDISLLLLISSIDTG